MRNDAPVKIARYTHAGAYRIVPAGIKSNSPITRVSMISLSIVFVYRFFMISTFGFPTVGNKPAFRRRGVQEPVAAEAQP
jgi:hypothetical protein